VAYLTENCGCTYKIIDTCIVFVVKFGTDDYLINKSWKPECVGSFNMGTLRHIRIEINHGSQNVF
jgi:hypothetical protein